MVVFVAAAARSTVIVVAVAVTAVGTLVRWVLFRTSEPASLPEDAVEERTKMGVFETQASITAIAPTVCAQQCSRHCKAGSMSEP